MHASNVEYRYKRRPASRAAMTLVELMVVIAIVGVLLALLLPAVQAARERARRGQCASQLRQVAIAIDLHVDSQVTYPAGGWGGDWTGDPRRGYGAGQPGGWVYAILEYLGEGALRSGDRGVATAGAARPQATDEMRVVIATLICPSRRDATTFPHVRPYALVNATPAEAVARSDYAMSGGSTGTNSLLRANGQAGPRTLESGEGAFPWPANDFYTGVIRFNGSFEPKHVIDGLSRTYLAGEKYLSTRHYSSGRDGGDRGFALIGYSPDTVRMTTSGATPQRDNQRSNPRRFGSAHPAACLMVFCDGSVRPISYKIEESVHRSNGNRRDR